MPSQFFRCFLAAAEAVDVGCWGKDERTGEDVRYDRTLVWRQMDGETDHQARPR